MQLTAAATHVRLMGQDGGDVVTGWEWPAMWLLVGGESEIGAAAHRYLTARGQAVSVTTRRLAHESATRPLFDLSIPLDGWEPPADTQAACIFAGVSRLAACAADPVGSAQVNVVQTIALIERLL